MFCTKLIFSISAVLAILTPIQGAFGPQGRMSGGSAVETLRRFPHHVLIQDQNNNYYQNEERRFCAGSILNQRSIITSANCIKYYDVLVLSFQRLYLTKSNGSYSAIVNRDAVFEYPTQYDDIAIIKLPFSLIYSDTVKPVGLYRGPNIAAGQFAVLSGYDNSTSYNNEATIPPILNSDNQMAYGMFSILSAAACKAELDKEFDEYLQYCTKPWSNTRNSPSVLDIGSGLLTGWPAAPKLIGIYTGSNNWNNVATYTNVAKYADWIDGVASGNIYAA